MAVLNRQRVVINDMENANAVYLEKSLDGIDQRHLSTVQITEYPDSGLANPEPCSDNQGDDLEDFLSPQFLKHLSGKNNLSEVTYLKMEVDTTETSIGNLGQLLPNLKQLKLSNSAINSIRDLGTCLNDLNTLWLQRCGLVDLDGISCFNSLKELYLAYNEIDDLSSLSMLENLSFLDLEGNNVDDIAQVEFLGLCTNLVSLSLSGNPIELAPHPDTTDKDLKFYDYRSAVSKAIPKLRILDDEPFLFDIIDGKSVIRSTASNKEHDPQDLKDDIFMVQESLKSLSAIDEDEDSEQVGFESGRPEFSQRQDGFRPLSSRSRPISSRNRPMSSRKRPISSRNRPMSSLAQRNRSLLMHDRPTTSHVPESSLTRPESVKSGLVNGASEDSVDEDDSSDLTHGSKQVICGNPVRALLARRKELRGDFKLKFDRNSPEVPSDQFIPEHSYHLDEDNTNEDNDRQAIFEELKRWRDNFEKSSSDLATPDSAVSDLPVKESRSTLSPTPPSGNPSRPSRRNLARHPELQRPHTAYDFMPSASRNMVESRKAQVISRSIDVPQHRQVGHEDADRVGDRSSNIKEKPIAVIDSELSSQQENKGRTRYYRPGTAAAAFKKRSQKHFT